ncbi:MAG: hypothetical protein E7675_04095 [Ruminococcaceae bacterium]|nr:hypothetical protein [Oscillospiraceae bacterium]
MFDPDIYEKYSKIIKRIKICRVLLTIFTVVAVFATLILSGLITINGSTVVKEGLSLPITLLIIVLLLIVTVFVAAFINMPIINALYFECDPEKSFVLSEKLLSGSQQTLYLTQALLAMGKFTLAMNHLRILIDKSKKTDPDLIFQKAGIEFFTGDYDSMKTSIDQFLEYRRNCKNTNKKQSSILDKCSTVLMLFSAIAENDREKIKILGKAVEPWTDYKLTTVYVAYLKGISAHLTGDKLEAIYQLSYIIKNYDKTFMAPLARDIISSYDNDQNGGI